MDYTEEQIEYIRENCTPVDEDSYREWLDSMDGEIDVCGLKFNASDILEELDPIAFRCGYSDYTDAGGFVEVDGDYFDQDKVDNALQELEDESEVDDESQKHDKQKWPCRAESVYY